MGSDILDRLSKSAGILGKWEDEVREEIAKCSPSSERGSVLIEAHKTINGARQNVYGSPEDSFALIAQYWNTYLVSVADKVDGKHAITSSDVAMMMALFKIAREANQHKADNIIDCAGYLGIYADMQEGG